MTYPHHHAARVQCLLLEYRFLALVVAACTKLMRGLTSCHRTLFQRVGSDPSLNLNQMVALLLSIPCFKLSDALFQLCYALNQRRAVLLNRKHRLLGLEHLFIEFEEFRLRGLGITQSYQRRREVLGRLQRRCGLGNLSEY